MRLSERALLGRLQLLLEDLTEDSGPMTRYLARRRAEREARRLMPAIRTLLERQDLADEARDQDRRWAAYLQARLEDESRLVAELRRQVLELSLAHPGEVTEVTPTGAIISHARPPAEDRRGH